MIFGFALVALVGVSLVASIQRPIIRPLEQPRDRREVDSNNFPTDVANKLLVVKEKSSNFTKNIEAARTLLKKSDDPKVREIFEQLIAQRYVYPGSCNESNIDGLIKMQQVLISYSNPSANPYGIPQYARRINRLVIGRMDTFFRSCLGYLVQDYELNPTAKQVNELEAVKRVTILVSSLKREFEKLWPDNFNSEYHSYYSRYDRRNDSRILLERWMTFINNTKEPIYEIDPYTGEAKVTEETMRELYRVYVADPCELFIQANQDISLSFSLLANYIQTSSLQQDEVQLMQANSVSPLRAMRETFASCKTLTGDIRAQIISKLTETYNEPRQSVLHKMIKEKTLRLREEESS